MNKLTECYICLEEIPEYNLYDGLCSKACYIYSFLENYEDQQYTNDHGIEAFDVESYLNNLPQKLVSNRDKCCLNIIFDELFSHKSTFYDRHVSLYTPILEAIKEMVV